MRLGIYLLLWIGLIHASIWHQTTWHGGSGQEFYKDTTRYLREEGVVDDTIGELSLTPGWRRITSLPETRVVYDIIEDVNHTIWAATSEGKVFKSSNSGNTWEETSPLPKAKEIRCLFPFGNIIFASGICEDDSARIYKTSDGGKSWVSEVVMMDKGIKVVASKIFSIKLYGRTLYAAGSSQDGKGVVFATQDIENLKDWIITGPGIRGSKVYDIEFFLPKNILFASTDGGEIYAYDPDRKLWRLEKRLPLAKDVFTLISYKDKLFAGASCADNTARVYTMIEGEWRMSKPLSYAGAVLDIIGLESEGAFYPFAATAGSDSVARIFFSQEPYINWMPFGDVFGPATRIEALAISLSLQNLLAGSAPDGGIYLLGYKESGYLESSRYVITPPKVVYDSIRWDCSGEEVRVKVRTVPDSFPPTEPSWSNCPYLQNGQSLKGVDNINKGEGFVDYRIELLSPSPQETPIFKEISIYYHLDTIPPDNPDIIESDENHPKDSISYDPVITMTWSKGYDPNGIKGYAVSFDTNPSSIPDTSLLITDTSFTDTLSSGEWWFHLMTCDSLGNWTESSVDIGPYRIIVDTTALRLSLDFNPDTCYIGDTVEVEVTTSKILSAPYRESLAVEFIPEGLSPETLFAFPRDDFTYLLEYPTKNKNPGEVKVRTEAEDMAGNRGEAEGSFLILALPLMELLPMDSAYAYPNPASGDSICIRYFLSEKAKVTITLYTMDGFKIDEFSSDNEPGINRRWFSISQLPNDVYIFRVFAQGESRDGKVIKKFAILR